MLSYILLSVIVVPNGFLIYSINMEVIITFFSKNLSHDYHYYVSVIGLFEGHPPTVEVDEVYLNYLPDQRVQLVLKFNPILSGSVEISLQIENAETLFKHIDSQNLTGCGIDKKAFSFKGEFFPLLTAPNGNYFCSIDHSGNRVIFFDKPNHKP